MRRRREGLSGAVANGAERMYHDLRLVSRSLARAPDYAFTVVLCLTIGISAAASALQVFDELFFRPPAGVRDERQLARVRFSVSGGQDHTPRSKTSFPHYTLLASARGALSGVAAYYERDFGLRLHNGSGGIRGALVSSNYFDVLGLRPYLGQLFSRQDTVPFVEPTAVLSYALWQRLSADSSIGVGKTIVLNGQSLVVLGVAPPSFHGIGVLAEDVWIPLSQAQLHGPGSAPLEDYSLLWLDVVARISPGHTMAQASQELNLRNITAQSVLPSARRTVTLDQLRRDQGPAGEFRQSIGTWIGIIAGLLLFASCTNVSALSLARWTAQREQIVLRYALGARGTDVGRLVLSEALLLCMVAAGLGTAASLWGSELLRIAGGSGPTEGPSRTVLVGIAVICVVGTASFAPAAWFSCAVRPRGGMKGGVKSGAAFVQRVVVVLQFTTAITLVAGAMSLVSSFRRFSNVELGFEANGLLAARFETSGVEYGSVPQWELLRQLKGHALQLPFVVDASLASAQPFGSRSFVAASGIDGRTEQIVLIYEVDESYFRTLGLRLKSVLANFGAAHAASQVAVVNESAATIFWPGSEAVGSCIRHSAGPADGCVRVIGVSNTPRYASLGEEATPALYVPLDPERPTAAQVVLVRLRKGVRMAPQEFQQILLNAAPDLPFIWVDAPIDKIDSELRPWRVGSAAYAVFASLALAVCWIGLVGTVRLLAVQRRREIGLRLALGSSRAAVIRIVYKHITLLLVVGALGGVASAFAGLWLMQQSVQNLLVPQPTSVVAAAVLLISLLLVSIIRPVLAATNVSPMTALRSE